MGPQHDSCGRVCSVLASALDILASMGPQHDSCGRDCVWHKERIRKSLQWGRNMIVAEGLERRVFGAKRARFNGAAT